MHRRFLSVPCVCLYRSQRRLSDRFARHVCCGACRSNWAKPWWSTTRPVAGGAIGSVEVKRSQADGYTLSFGTASTHGLYNLIQTAPQYDALEDFSFVGVLGGAPVVFVVNPSMPRTLKTVVIASKAAPGKYNYGSPGTGTLLHVATERLKKVTGATIAHIP